MTVCSSGASASPSRCTSSAGCTRRGKNVIEVDGKSIPFTAYSPTARPELFYEQTARFFHDGTRVFFLNVPRADAGPPPADDFFATPFWHGNTLSAEPLLSAVTPTLDEQASFTLKHRPTALLLIRFPSWESASWRALHPGELFVDEQGQVIQRPSLASAVYRDDTARYVQAVLSHCEGRPWGDRTIGYWTGMRFEGTHEPLVHRRFYDHSPLFLAAWRRFLRDRYGSDAAFRDAWGVAGVIIDIAAFPADEITGDFFQAGPANAPYRDYLLLRRDLFALQVKALADAHRRATDRGRVFLLDTLKLPMQGWDNASFFDAEASWPGDFHDMLAGSGHTDASHLLNTPGLDGIITPHDYQARGLGGVYEPEGPADSLALRRKLFLCEMDTRSYTGSDGPVFGSADDPEEFAAITWRSVAASITRGFHSYYMDVHTDWFGDPSLHAIIARQMQVMEEALHWEHRAVPGIAVILEDAAPLETNGNGAYANEAVFWQVRDGLARCGVPVRLYLLGDLDNANLLDHRVFYFPNLFKLDDQRLDLIKRRVLGRGRTVVWGSGSGISDGRTLSADHASRLTGFNFEMLPGNLQRRTLIHDFDHPLTAGLTGDQTLGGPLAFGPALFPTDGRSLGRAWTRQGRNLSGLAVKSLGDGNAAWHSVFTTTVPLPAGFWRGATRPARGHVYGESDDVLMADVSCVALHCVSPGKKRLHLPAFSRVTDVVTGKPLAKQTSIIGFTATNSGTRISRLEVAPDADGVVNKSRPSRQAVRMLEPRDRSVG